MITNLVLISTCLVLAIVTLGPSDSARGLASWYSVGLASLATRAQTLHLSGIELVCIFVVLAAGCLRRSGSSFEIPRAPVLLFALYYVVQGVSTLTYNPNALTTFGAFACLFLLLIVTSSRFSVQDLRMFLFGMIALAALHSAFGLGEVVTGEPFWGHTENRKGTGAFIQLNYLIPTDIPRLEGATGHSIVFGLFLSVGVLSIALMKRFPFLGIPAIAMFFTGILFSGSRGVLVALGTSLVYVLVLRSKRRSLLFRVGVYIVVAGSAVVVLEPLLQAIAPLLETGSFTNRLEGLTSSLELLRRSAGPVLIGSGFGSEGLLFDQGYLQQSSDFRVIDNQFVTVVATSGLIGMALFVGAVATVLWIARESLRPFVVLITAMMFTFDLLNWYSVSLLFAVLMGICCIRHDSSQGPRETLNTRTATGGA